MNDNFNNQISKIKIHPPQDFSHSSYIITGIIKFCVTYFIQCKFCYSLDPKLGRILIERGRQKRAKIFSFPKLLCVDLILKDNRIIKLGFDMYDLADHFPLYALEHCNLVFKRNYETKYVNRLDENHRKKIFKLGMCFGVYDNNRIPFKIFTSSLLQNLKAHLKYDRYIFKRLSSTYKKVSRQRKFVKTQRTLDQFENFQKGTENSILFQTRVFPNEHSKDTQQIHADRYRLIKLLRKEFPNHFKGGFIASSLAKERYSDALTNVPSEPQAYLKAVKAAKIVIYTRGLANSPAWKMAEYLSQGKVIIAEPLTAELPVPLKHGREVLFFENDQELVSQIKLVLEDVKLREHLSRNARLYFEQHVHPVKTIERIFSITLQHA